MARLSPKGISVIIILGVLVWIGTGLVFGTKRAEQHQKTGESGSSVASLIKVEERDAEPYTRQIAINGYTKANRMVEMKPEVDGKVVELPVKKGSTVKKGQVIVRLDNRDRMEKLNRAKADFAARSIQYNASETLAKQGYRPKLDVAQAKADLENAKATVAQAQLDVDNMQVRAPFDGRLEELNIEVGDFLLSGFLGSMNTTVMARLVEDDPIKVAGQVSEKDLPLVNKDADVEVSLSDGRTLTGRVTFLSQYADAASRSFPVEVTVPNPEHNVPVGMTATIKLSASKGSAYLVSSSVLALDDAGKVGVKLVGDDGVVQFVPVDILANTEEGLWIGGLPEHIRLVTQGQAFVSAGQKANTQNGKE